VRILNIAQPYRPPWPITGIVLLFFYLYYKHVIPRFYLQPFRKGTQIIPDSLYCGQGGRSVRWVTRACSLHEGEMYCLVAAWGTRKATIICRMHWHSVNTKPRNFWVKWVGTDKLANDTNPVHLLIMSCCVITYRNARYICTHTKGCVLKWLGFRSADLSVILYVPQSRRFEGVTIEKSAFTFFPAMRVWSFHSIREVNTRFN
jgi:hypothetical protein